MRRAAYVAYRGFAGLFVLGVLVQYFLAGLGVFESESVFEIHATIGLILGGVALVVLLLAGGLTMSGELDRTTAGMAGLLVTLMIVQYLLVELFSEAVPPLAALHPVNGLLVLGVALLLASGGSFKSPTGPANV